MTEKIFKGIFFSCLATMLACLILIVGVLYTQFDDRLKTELESKTQLVAMGMNTHGSEYLKNLNEIPERVTHIAADGTVLFDSASDTANAQNHSTREEVLEALKYGIGESQRNSDTLGKEWIYYAILLSDGTVIRLATTKSTVGSLFLKVVPPIVFIAVLIILGSLGLSVLLSKRIVRPINEIDPNNPAEQTGYEEISPLLKKIRAQNRKIAREKEKLSKSREEFRLITQNMSEGLIIIDNRANILSCNDAAVRMLANEQSEVVGKSIFVIYDGRELIKAVEAALNGQNAEQTLTLNGRVYQIIISPAYSKEVLSGAVMVILDITEREQRELLRREFTSNVSHELKTPLTSIYGISDMLTTGMVKNEDIKGFASDINREAGRLINLVEDIIHLSRLDEGGFEIQKQAVDIKAIATTAVKSIIPTAQNNNISINLVADDVMVLGQETILNDIIYNLIDNAVKYNRSGGYVNVTVEDVNDEAVITVADNGIGIPKGEQERVFERFYRVDKSHSRSIGGTGLGLSIVKRGVAYHGGKINLESAEGSGTMVTVTLPK